MLVAGILLFYFSRASFVIWSLFWDVLSCDWGLCLRQQVLFHKFGFSSLKLFYWLVFERWRAGVDDHFVRIQWGVAVLLHSISIILFLIKFYSLSFDCRQRSLQVLNQVTALRTFICESVSGDCTPWSELRFWLFLLLAFALWAKALLRFWFVLILFQELLRRVCLFLGPLYR